MKFTEPALGRKGAFYQRNRASLVHAAQRSLASIGPDVKIEDVAKEAEMAVSTIYKHFPNRDELIKAAIVEAMSEWESDVFERTKNPAALVQLIEPMKAFLRMKQTHPLFAEIISKNNQLVSQLAPVATANLSIHVARLAKEGVLKIDQPEIRTRNLVACLLAAVTNEISTETKSTKDNLKAIQIALGMIGIDSETAGKILEI